MAEVKKARLFLRRGTDTDRKTTTLCEGELGYSTDAFRVVIGDGSTVGARSVGTTAFISAGTASANFHTRLTEASGGHPQGGYAHRGDLAVFGAQSYTKANGVAISYPSVSACTVMMLTAAQVPGAESQSTPTSWVAINSGIPWGNLHVQDDDITGNYVSGGVISAPIAISGGGDVHITGSTTTEHLVLSSVALGAQKSATLIAQGTPGVAGESNIIYPLGITATSVVTAASSIYELGVDESSSGYLAATSIGALSANHTGSSANGAGGSLTASSLISKNVMTGYPGTGIDTGYPVSNTRPTVIYYEYTITLDNIRDAIGKQGLSWAAIKSFDFEMAGLVGESQGPFFGYHNEQCGRNVVLTLEVDGVKGGRRSDANQRWVTHNIPNAYKDNEQLKIHVGRASSGGSCHIRLVGVIIK